eukprot:s1367_g4.t1
MESRQNSFFSSKMTHFLSDTENEARQQAMEKAVKEVQNVQTRPARVETVLPQGAQGAQGALADAQVKRIPTGVLGLHGDTLLLSRAKGPLVHTHYALAGRAGRAGAMDFAGVEVRRDPKAPLTITARPLVTVHEVSSEFLRAVSPKKVNEHEIKIEANEQLVRKACCFWDCRVNEA